MSRDEMHALQSKRLQKLVNYVYHNVPFYRNKMQAMDVSPDDIRSIGDIVKLPFTTKQDLRDNYPYGLQAAPPSEIVRVHASSGTTGNPTIVGYTRKDLSVWSEVMARCLTAFGVKRDDTFSVAYGYGLFTGGLGAHYGVENLGATVIPTSTGNTDKHIRLIRDLNISGIACTPSYALYLAETLDKMGLSKEDINLRIGAFGAEPWTENMRKEIEERLGLKGYNIYGLSEIMGPGVSYECQEQNGSHINEDHFYPEIINPDTLEQLPHGQQRTGIHHPHQGGHASVEVSHQGPLHPHGGRMCLRSHISTHGSYRGPKRRYAHHPWYQRIPIPGGECHTGNARVRTSIHARC